MQYRQLLALLVIAVIVLAVEAGTNYKAVPITCPTNNTGLLPSVISVTSIPQYKSKNSRNFLSFQLQNPGNIFNAVSVTVNAGGTITEQCYTIPFSSLLANLKVFLSVRGNYTFNFSGLVIAPNGISFASGPASAAFTAATLPSPPRQLSVTLFNSQADPAQCAPSGSTNPPRLCWTDLNGFTDYILLGWRVYFKVLVAGDPAPVNSRPAQGKGRKLKGLTVGGVRLEQAPTARQVQLLYPFESPSCVYFSIRPLFNSPLRNASFPVLYRPGRISSYSYFSVGEACETRFP